jgi:hypothetical protein
MIVVGLYLQERIEIQAEQTQVEYWDHLDSIRHVESSPCSTIIMNVAELDVACRSVHTVTQAHEHDMREQCTSPPEDR